MQIMLVFLFMLIIPMLIFELFIMDRKRIQHKDFKKHARKNESYEHFCRRYYSHYLNTMKCTKFFLNGKEISRQEAKTIEKKNKEYMNSGNFSLMLKCQFITVVKVDK